MSTRHEKFALTSPTSQIILCYIWFFLTWFVDVPLSAGLLTRIKEHRAWSRKPEKSSKNKIRLKE